MMGVAFTFKAESREGAITMATDFVRDISKAIGNRASVVGIVRNNTSYLAVVDVCGKRSIKMARIAKKHGAV